MSTSTMPKIEISYRISEAAQDAEFRAGRDATDVRRIEITADSHPLSWAAAVVSTELVRVGRSANDRRLILSEVGLGRYIYPGAPLENNERLYIPPMTGGDNSERLDPMGSVLDSDPAIAAAVQDHARKCERKRAELLQRYNEVCDTIARDPKWIYRIDYRETYTSETRGCQKTYYVAVLPSGYLADHPAIAAAIEDMVPAAQKICDQKNAEEERRIAEEIAAKKARTTARKAEEEAAAREKSQWIAEHGSNRLRLAAAEKIEHTAIYRDERLARDRPGWDWAAKYRGDYDDPRNPSEDALIALQDARTTAPDARLVYWSVQHDHDDCEYDDDAPDYDYKGYALLSDFLGRKIVRFVGDVPPLDD